MIIGRLSVYEQRQTGGSWGSYVDLKNSLVPPYNKFHLAKTLCDICLKCFNSPLALFYSRLLERKQYVRNPRGKITAPKNFAEI